MVKNTSGIIYTQQLFNLPVGNPNVYNIVNAINSVLQSASFLSFHLIISKIKLYLLDLHHKSNQ